MTKLRVLGVALLCAACSPGSIIDPRAWNAPEQTGAAGYQGGATAGSPPLGAAWRVPDSDVAGTLATATAGAGAVTPQNPVRDDPTATNPQNPGATGAAGRPATTTPPPASMSAGSGASDAGSAGTGTNNPPPPAADGGSVGTGDINSPASGPAPTDAAKVSGAPFVLVKNWDFGSDGTIRDIADLSAEFQYKDNFGTIANGSNYGAVIVAPDAAHADGNAGGLGLPNNKQPVEDPARPYRQFTGSTLQTFIRPLSESQSSIAATSHNAGCGSITAKWKLPNGGALLKKDLLWESRVRMPASIKAYWFAIWTAGNQWNKGAEMDVLESFGTPNISFDAFHSDPVGGTGTVDFSSWPNALTKQGVPSSDRALSQWHIWTWVYLRDDSFQVFYDGYLVQKGTLHWTNGGGAGGQPIDMSFLFDFGWGHTQVSDVNITLPVSQLPDTPAYEIDYSRVYLRQ
jgi:hypothetical protein